MVGLVTWKDIQKPWSLMQWWFRTNQRYFRSVNSRLSGRKIGIFERDRLMNKQQIYDYLNQENVWYEITEHEAVYNMAELSNIEIPYPEYDAKNLFVRDDRWDDKYFWWSWKNIWRYYQKSRNWWVKKQSFFELKTTNLNGEENEYQLQMTLTEVIKAADN